MTAAVTTEVSATPTFPVAPADRRFYAATIDRLVAWSLAALVGTATHLLFTDDGSLLVGVLLATAVLLLVGAGFAVLQGRTGLTPGKALLGLRVVEVGSGTPLGAGPSLLRSLVLGVSALPTFGIGLATLAWTAVMDPDRLRRGWHDHLTGSVVVDVRPVPAEETQEEPQLRQIVNLTAMRLVPAPPPAPAPTLTRREQPAPAAPAPAVSTARWRVTFDTGESLLVEGLALVGRRPEPRAGEQVRHLLALPSQDMSLSKTHAQFQVAPDGALVVIDRGSTNGSVLVRGGAARELPPGRPTTVLSADVVRFGDRHMTVLRES